MSDWTPIQFVPLECTAIRLHQIFKEWPLYFDEMTISIFLPHTNLRFLISFFFFMRYPGFALLIIYRITITETLQKCKLHTRDKETLVRGELRLLSHCCFQPWNYPHFSLITWTNWQDVLGRIHPPTRPCILHAFWRTRAVHLTKREIEHLFFMEREWVRVKWDGCVFLLPCDRDALVCAWQWQTTDQRSTSTVTNACIEWLTAPNTSLLLISCIFGDKSCPSHLKSGSAAECRI